MVDMEHFEYVAQSIKQRGQIVMFGTPLCIELWVEAIEEATCIELNVVKIDENKYMLKKAA